MSNKLLFTILTGAAVILLSGYFIFNLASRDDSTIDPSSEIQPTQSTNNENVTTQTFTLQDVSQKNSRDECWTIIENRVYDITKYISSHPGGSEIDRACGIDSTSLFNERKTVEGESVGSGTPHSQRAKASLSEFYIGELR